MDSFIEIVTEHFNNRELAAGAWLFIIIALLVFYKPTRKIFPQIVKIVLRWKFLTVCLFLTLYVFLTISVLSMVGFWDISHHLKDTIIWTVTVAFVFVLNISDTTKEDKFFQKVFLDTIKLTIVLEFIIGLYTYSIFVEFLLLPVLVFLFLMVAIAGSKKEYLPIKKILEWLIAIIGFVILWHSIQNLIANSTSLFTFDRLIDLMLPSLLTILFIPFVYCFAVIVEYEKIFIKLTVRNQDTTLVKYAKRQILLHFGFNLIKLTKWSKRNPRLKINNKAEILELVDK